MFKFTKLKRAPIANPFNNNNYNQHARTEAKLHAILNMKYKTQRSFAPQWCKNPATNRLLPFDFVIESHNIIIELDGPHHFRQVANWRSHHITQQIDVFKMHAALCNNYSVVRLLQQDVWHMTDWYNKLINIIDNSNQTTPMIHYIAKNKTYNHHISLSKLYISDISDSHLLDLNRP